MTRKHIVILSLSALIALLPVVELKAQQRRSRGGNNGNNGFNQGFGNTNNNGADQSNNNNNNNRSAFGNYRGNFGATNNQPPATTMPAGIPGAAPNLPTVAAVPVAELVPPGKPLPGDLEILSHKSMFDKDRHERPQRQSNWNERPQTVASVRPPGVPILVGVLLGDNDYMAYLEDPDSSRVWPFAAGDNLPNDFGKLVSVTLNDIEIAKDGESPKHILIGQNLRGESAVPGALPASPVTSSPSSPSTGATTSAPAGDTTNIGDLSIEAKMKLRRLQQMTPGGAAPPAQ